MKITTIHGDTIELSIGMEIEEAMLRERILDGVDLTGSSLRECFFNESSLRNAVLRDCDLSGSVFYRTDLTGADLTGATLHRCYWNEAIFDETTRWPHGFVLPTGKRVLAESTDGPQPQYYPSGLCTPGVIMASELDIEIPRPTQFVPDSIPHGSTSPRSHEALLLRLAALIYRATYDEARYDDLSTPLFGRDDLDDDEYYRDIVFTHICMALTVTGIRITGVLDQNQVEVTFEPVPDMGSFVAKPLFRLFLLLAEELYGQDTDEVLTIENAMNLETDTEYEWLFAEQLGLDFDLSNAWTGADRDVTTTRQPEPTDDPQSEILKCLLRYHFAVTHSVARIPDTASEDWETSIDLTKNDMPWDVVFPSLAAWHIMGVQEINRLPDGRIRAVLRPRIDTDAAIQELWPNDVGAEDDGDRLPFATRPHAGRFAGHL